MLGEPFCRSLEETNVESNAEDTWLVRFKGKIKDSIGAICYFDLRFFGSG